jgi:hypothetical protein
VTVTRIGDRVGQPKATKPATSVVEMAYKEMTGKEKAEFSLLVRKELYDAVPGAIRALRESLESKGNVQAKVAAARQLLLLSEKHGVLGGSMDPLAAFSESLAAELEDRRED